MLTGHVDKILISCASSIYAIKVLGGERRPTTILHVHEVTRATMVARLLYASPSWFGFLKAAALHRLENLFRRAKRGSVLLLQLVLSCGVVKDIVHSKIKVQSKYM